MSDQWAQDQPADRDKPQGEPPTAEPNPGSRQFLEEVRRIAGWRVSPRQVDAAVGALREAGEEPAPARVVQVAETSYGERSQRQRRNTGLWRQLGAHLAVQGKPSDPAAQLDFVGAARGIAGPEAADFFLLQVALRCAAQDVTLAPRTVGLVCRRILEHHGPDLTAEEIADAVPEALATVIEAQRQPEHVQKRTRRRPAAAETARPRPRSKGRRPRGSSYGGKRRRRS